VSAARRASSKTFAALSVRNFRLFFIGQLISVSGTWMQSVAQGWLILQLTGSSVDLGFAIALQYVPILLFGTYGGLVADRHEKRRILYFTQTSAGLLALTLGLLMTTHHVTVDTVYVLASLLGFVNLFDVPARQAFVQEMVGRDLIANAVSLNSVLMNSGRVIGPSVAAGLIALVGTAVCFYTNAASYVAVILALALMRRSELLPMQIVQRQPGQLRLGLKYVFRNTFPSCATSSSRSDSWWWAPLRWWPSTSLVTLPRCVGGHVTFSPEVGGQSSTVSHTGLWLDGLHGPFAWAPWAAPAPARPRCCAGSRPSRPRWSRSRRRRTRPAGR
jgi:MFS family permease